MISDEVASSVVGDNVVSEGGPTQRKLHVSESFGVIAVCLFSFLATIVREL